MMKPKTVYLALSIAGVALPYSQFLPWLSEHGLNLPLLIHELFANRISLFFGIDVFVSALALIAFIFLDARPLRIGRAWIPLLALFVVGVSLALPLFLYLRETQNQSVAKPTG